MKGLGSDSGSGSGKARLECDHLGEEWDLFRSTVPNWWCSPHTIPQASIVVVFEEPEN